uniref:uncharacterized protein LOC120339499 n=1 Tax=Styela clava TaxID=7725 RepID=UPI00193A7E44|nr:uncharacterized protein LOC120339499 [Styela clava]
MLNSMEISVSKTCIQVYAVALFLLINLKDLQAANLCPEIQGCRCLKDSTSHGETDTADGTMKISCSSMTDPKLHLMPHENITQLILSRVTIANLSILDELRKTKLNKLSLYRNNFGETAVFTWKWIPDSITTISLSRNGFINFANGEEDCNFTRMKNNLTIHISDEKISLLSLCLPESTTKLSISNIQHSKQETIEMTKWPRNIAYC